MSDRFLNALFFSQNIFKTFSHLIYIYYIYYYIIILLLYYINLFLWIFWKYIFALAESLRLSKHQTTTGMTEHFKHQSGGKK